MAMRSSIPSERLVNDYATSVARRGRALGTVCDSLQALDYVSADAPGVIRAIGVLAAEVVAGVEEQRQRFLAADDEKGRRTAYVMLQATDHRLREVAAQLRLPARATADNVPGVMSRLLSQEAARILGTSGCAVVLRPKWDYNFTIRSEPIHQSLRTKLQMVVPGGLATVNAALANVTEPLYFVSFPIVERTSIHLHAVFGHELGHIITANYSEDSAAFQSFRKQIRNDWLKANPDKMPGLQEPLRFLNEDDILTAEGSRRVAMREFAADTAGVYLFGIAAVLGAADVAVSKGLIGERSTRHDHYPTWGLRLLNMIQVAEERGWMNPPIVIADAVFERATAAAFGTIEELKSWVGDDVHALQDTHQWAARGHASAMEQWAHIRRYVMDDFGKKCPEPTQVYSRLPRLLDRVLRRVPPDNFNADELDPERPALVDVFTVTWWGRALSTAVARPKQKDDTGNIEPHIDVPDSTIVARLALKAVENIDFDGRFGEVVRRSHQRGPS